MSLSKTILSGRLNLGLTALTIASALLVVTVEHRSRTLFIELEVAHSRTRQLELEWAQLQLEQSVLSKSERIESIATKDLGMEHITSARTQYLSETLAPQ
jgi:cell division protein FtsL